MNTALYGGPCLPPVETGATQLLLPISLEDGNLYGKAWPQLGGFAVEAVLPGFLHVIPVGDEAVLNGALQGT